MRAGSREAKEWGRKMSMLRKRKPPGPRKRKGSFRRKLRKVARTITHPVRTYKLRRRKKHYSKFGKRAHYRSIEVSEVLVGLAGVGILSGAVFGGSSVNLGSSGSGSNNSGNSGSGGSGNSGSSGNGGNTGQPPILGPFTISINAPSFISLLGGVSTYSVTGKLTVPNGDSVSSVSWTQSNGVAFAGNTSVFPQTVHVPVGSTTTLNVAVYDTQGDIALASVTFTDTSGLIAMAGGIPGNNPPSSGGSTGPVASASTQSGGGTGTQIIINGSGFPANSAVSAEGYGPNGLRANLGSATVTSGGSFVIISNWNGETTVTVTYNGGTINAQIQ